MKFIGTLTLLAGLASAGILSTPGATGIYKAEARKSDLGDKFLPVTAKSDLGDKFETTSIDVVEHTPFFTGHGPVVVGGTFTTTDTTAYADTKFSHLEKRLVPSTSSAIGLLITLPTDNPTFTTTYGKRSDTINPRIVTSTIYSHKTSTADINGNVGQTAAAALAARAVEDTTTYFTTYPKHVITPLSDIKRAVADTTYPKHVITPFSDVKRAAETTPYFTTYPKHVITPLSDKKRAVADTTTYYTTYPKHVITPLSDMKRAVADSEPTFTTTYPKHVITPFSDVKRAVADTTYFTTYPKHVITPLSDNKKRAVATKTSSTSSTSIPRGFATPVFWTTPSAY